MSELIVKILAFCLGIKRQSPEEMAAAGARIRVKQIIDSIQSRSRIELNNVSSIWNVGCIKVRENRLNVALETFQQGNLFKFDDLKSFDFGGDYVDFYQLEMKDHQYFIVAITDMASPSMREKVLMFNPIKSSYDISNLQPSRKYYPFEN